MKVAIEGCCHSELDAIYAAIRRAEEEMCEQVDLLLISGDFQAVRNEADMECLSAPKKYRRLGDFHKYYSGEKKAPILTVFVGGNHEASNYLWELYYGGWVCPNIYYMGAANIINIGGLRVAGLSGIYKRKDYAKGHFERVPYNLTTLRTVYHVREFEVSKLLSAPKTEPIDIFLSHDWPRGIEKYGDCEKLLLEKPYLSDDIQNNNLGSIPNEHLLDQLQPKYWFAAHMHVKFEATKIHGLKKESTEKAEWEKSVKNPDEVDLSDDMMNDSLGDSTDASNSLNNEKKNASPNVTRFLALDKCLPDRHFLEILDIPAPFDNTDEKLKLSYDVDWLALCRVFHPYFSLEQRQTPLPKDQVSLAMEIEKEKKWVQEHIVHLHGLEIPRNFEHTAPIESPDVSNQHPPPLYDNPQTQAFCKMLGISNKIYPC